MEDLRHWDFAEKFTGEQAACLIAGIEPGQAGDGSAKVAPILNRLRDTYNATAHWHYIGFYNDEEYPPDQNPPPKIQIVSVDFTKNACPDWLRSDEGQFNRQHFSREAICGWLDAIGMSSKYAFKRDVSEPTALTGTRWPDHETSKLRALRLAAVRFWANYNPSEPDTAPKNADVSEWLQKEHAIAATVADVMASILRPDGLKTGPR